MAHTLSPMYQTLQVPTLSPLNMEEMRSLTPHTAFSLCPQETPANVSSQVKKHTQKKHTVHFCSDKSK